MVLPDNDEFQNGINESFAHSSNNCFAIAEGNQRNPTASELAFFQEVSMSPQVDTSGNTFFPEYDSGNPSYLSLPMEVHSSNASERAPLEKDTCDKSLYQVGLHMRNSTAAHSHAQLDTPRDEIFPTFLDMNGNPLTQEFWFICEQMGINPRTLDVPEGLSPSQRQ